MLLLLVKYTAKPGGGENFVREITASGILNTVRAEDGCEGYDYYFSAETRTRYCSLKMGFGKTAGSASSDSAHGRADENKREIYLGHLSRKNSFIKYQGIRYKRMPLFVGGECRASANWELSIAQATTKKK